MTIKETKDYLISLIERDTPKKVEIGTSKHFKFPICPNCKDELNEFYKNKYCKKCGQRLEWGESIYLTLDEALALGGEDTDKELENE